MKLMKKISLLIAICICLTVSCVYATWIYTKDNNVADQHQHLATALAGVTTDGNYGTYDLSYKNVNIEIDQKQPGDHTAVLNITGDIVLTYTPGANAPVEYKTSGIPTTFQFDTSIDQTTWAYEGNQIFAVDNTVYDVVWTPEEDGSFTFTIPAEEIANYISLANTFVLDTLVDYNNFNTALANGQIGIKISDGNVETNP